MNSLSGGEFQEFVQSKLQEWAEKVVKTQQVEVEVVPEIAGIFKSSKMVSSKSIPFLQSNLLLSKPWSN